MKKTKIIATFGPAVNTKQKVRKLVSEGVNLFRINCSHGTSTDFLESARLIRDATADARYPVGLLFDISGPKLRLDRFEGRLRIKAGGKITLTKKSTRLPEATIGVNHPGIMDSIERGERIFIDDGNLILKVLDKTKDTAVVKALNSGWLLPGKGINLPDSEIAIPTITAKDRKDIGTAIEAGADFIALSFVRSGKDIAQAKRLIARTGGGQKVIAKLEKREAVQSLDEIIGMSDGVMIARGDLGVELNPEDLPTLQRRIIRLANRAQKPVIVATQMLESMRYSPRATRAEINDVASAVFDFADAVMLSAETATGDYPVEAVRTMCKVIEATESEAVPPPAVFREGGTCPRIPLAVADAVKGAQACCDFKVIFAFTASGFTAEMISNLFPGEPVIALTDNRVVMRQLTLVRSVYAVEVEQPRSIAEVLSTVNNTCSNLRLARRGDRVIVTGGVPFGEAVPTNFMLIHQI
jgi:pyruvate kinase